MSREEEDKFIRETMADIADGIQEFEIVEEDIESILPDEEYEVVEEDMESILPDEGYEVVAEDVPESGLPDKEETMEGVAARAEEIDVNSGAETMADLVADLDGRPEGDSDKDTMTTLAQEITILESKMNIAKTQRIQIVDMKKEFSKARGEELANQRNGIDR